MCYLSPAGQPFLLSPPCPALAPLVSAAAPSLDPCFLSELAGSWGVEVAAFQCCVFGLREMTVILQRLAGGGPVVCGTQASNREAKDKRRHSGCLSTMRACLHPGMMPLRVWCFLVCRKEKGLRSWASILLLGMGGVYVSGPWS